MKQDPHNEIIQGLFLGDHRSSTDHEFLRDNKINLIVNCTKTLPFQTKYAGIEHVRVAVHDNLQDSEIRNMIPYIDFVCEKIAKYISTGLNVLVHCYAGRQRSACIVAALLMKKGNMSIPEAVAFVRKFRAVAFTPRVNFIKSLEIYEKTTLVKNIHTV